MWIPGTGRVIFNDMTLQRTGRRAAAFIGLLLALSAARAGPIETNVFAVQGVDADVTSTDAAAAKNQALMDVQVKAFYILAERLGSPELAKDVQAKFKPQDIAPYLKSLSIEEESSAPGRYIGKFTVRFLPEKMQKFFAGYGIDVPTTQAEPVLILPVWRAPETNQMWEDNPWRQAWLDLHGEQGLVPIIIPLGDLEDTETLTVEDALHNDPIKIEAIRRRYDAPSVLVAQAEPAEGGIHVYIAGDTRLGKVTFNKIYKSETGAPEPAAAAAVQKFQAALVDAYKKVRAQVAEAESSDVSHAIAVNVPFTSPTEWNRIRSRILSAPGVTGVEVSTLSIDGAVIRLTFSSSVPALQGNMQQIGLNLAQTDGSWVIQPM